MSFLDAARAARDAASRADPGPDPTRTLTVPAAGDLTNYLATVCDTVAGTPNGQRNDALNRAAYTLGRIVAAGQLDYMAVADALTLAGKAAGLGDDEIGPTIRSGLAAGEKEPRALDQRTPLEPPHVTVIEGAELDETHADAVRRLLPTLDWHALWADEDEEEWIIEPILPARRLVALYSKPKVGKSLLMLEMAVAVATGRTVLGVTPDRARRVLYVDFENDPKADVRERLQAMGYGPDDLGNLHYLSFPTLRALDSEAGSIELLAALEVYACEVVVIDTVSRSVAGEENENDTWLAFYRHTGLKLKQAGIALIRLDHSGKDESKGQRGGSAKEGDVDAVWRLSKVTDTVFRLDCEANRMQVHEKTLTLHRESLPHLHHRVDALGHKAADDARVADLVKVMDSLDIDPTMSRHMVLPLLKAAGHKGARPALFDRAIQARRVTVFGGPDALEYLSGQVPDPREPDPPEGRFPTGGNLREPGDNDA